MAGALDLSFVQDDLGSVDDEEFDDVIKFVPYMIDAFPEISSRGTRLGVVMYCTNVEISIPFHRYNDHKQLIVAVKSFNRGKGRTFTMQTKDWTKQTNFSTQLVGVVMTPQRFWL